MTYNHLMRLIRFQTASQGIRWGWVDDDRVGLVEGSPFTEFRRIPADLPLASVRLLAPVAPGKIIGVGENYPERIRQQGAPLPEIPALFIKPPSAVIAPQGRIILPPQSRQVEHAAVLAVVIGRGGRWIPADKALEHVLGYTAGNDITAADLQKIDASWTRSKSFDTFCPLGPWIETDLDPTDALITCHVNDALHQMASSRDMRFSVRQLIVFISSVMTLDPGDVILTGTPAGTSTLHPDDIIRVTVAGIGTLTNFASLS
jgi:2-keto-4-pentenoate hydratase/2-oxohepta-3-ene-1,7-dioic acid hydratase in catechol pathway